MTPFKPALYEPTDEDTIQAVMTVGKLTREKALEFIADSTRGEVFLNDTYQVLRRDAEVYAEGWPEMIWLSIKRIDREPIHDWRELQTIKNMLVGTEHEAVELYPAESRLTDTANQYHLWVLKHSQSRFPFGFVQRTIHEHSMGKSKQRPFSNTNNY
jgi:hypothetical protein